MTGGWAAAKSGAVSDANGAETGLRVKFGSAETRVEAGDAGVCLHLPLPVLGGSPLEVILGGGQVKEVEGFSLVESEGRLAGVATVPVAGGFQAMACDIYRRLLRVVGEGWQVYRIWNYVPAINDELDGLENYRAFNLGRWQAYEGAEMGPPVNGTLPAASAVGVQGGHLVVIFLAGRDPVDYFENPQQIPAYRYPAEYGPRPPCFCRGAKVGGGDVFLSGTASIRGHESTGNGNLEEQVAVTDENVRLMLGEMGANGGGRFKCYVRNEGDLDKIVSTLGERYREATYLKADICRAELLLEIEAVVPAQDLSR